MRTKAKGIILWSSKGHTISGLQFYTFWNFNMNKTENDRYWQKYVFTGTPVLFKLNIFKNLARSLWGGVAHWWGGVAQLAAHRLAVRQARVRFSARPHREVPPLSTQAMRIWREASANGDGWMYCDWMNVCMLYKIKINKKSGILLKRSQNLIYCKYLSVSVWFLLSLLKPPYVFTLPVWKEYDKKASVQSFKK